MKQIALTPVERGIVIILMTRGKPVKQADFEKVHGLAVKKQHREKLVNIGFIEVKNKPQITYALTKEGWAWVSQELTVPKPKGSMGLGPLYAALGAIARLTKRLGVPLEEALLEAAKDGTIRLPRVVVDFPSAGLNSVPESGVIRGGSR